MGEMQREEAKWLGWGQRHGDVTRQAGKSIGEEKANVKHYFLRITKRQGRQTEGRVMEGDRG